MLGARLEEMFASQSSPAGCSAGFDLVLIACQSGGSSGGGDMFLTCCQLLSCCCCCHTSSYHTTSHSCHLCQLEDLSENEDLLRYNSSKGHNTASFVVIYR